MKISKTVTEFKCLTINCNFSESWFVAAIGRRALSVDNVHRMSAWAQVLSEAEWYEQMVELVGVCRPENVQQHIKEVNADIE